MPSLPIVIFESALWLAGLLLLWQVIFGRFRRKSPALPAWTVSLEGFVMTILLVTAGGLLLPRAVTYLNEDVLGPAARDGDWWQVVQGAAFQLGMLSGAAASAVILRFSPRRTPAAGDVPPEARSTRPLLAGVAAFAISLPLISGIGLVWKSLLGGLGYPTGEQEMVDLFRNADDPARLVFMIVLAAVIAPVTEELIFRAGLFRYLRTRIPRSLALFLPSYLFALLHGNAAAFVPLLVLGMFFALAYEHTGRIAVPMVAHALFNLHTIVLVMAGVTV